MSDADLSGARLDEATLWGTNLQRSRLKRTALAGADLRYAHAERACLCAAELDEVLWGATELQRADLRGARGMRDDLQNSKLVSFDERTRWPRAKSWWWAKRS